MQLKVGTKSERVTGSAGRLLGAGSRVRALAALCLGQVLPHGGCHPTAPRGPRRGRAVPEPLQERTASLCNQPHCRLRAFTHHRPARSTRLTRTIKLVQTINLGFNRGRKAV